MSDNHLDDQKFSELLAGVAASQEIRQLRDCAHCQNELENVRSALDCFNQISLKVAEAQASTIEVNFAVPAPSSDRIYTGWIISLATAALVLTMLFKGHLDHRQEEKLALEIQRNISDQARQQIAADNRLLADIDGDLRWQKQSAVPISVSSLNEKE